MPAVGTGQTETKQILRVASSLAAGAFVLLQASPEDVVGIRVIEAVRIVLGLFVAGGSGGVQQLIKGWGNIN
jgi:hypothetical protein